jgi:hypothetical protein
MPRGAKGQAAYKPTREEIDRQKQNKPCGCCGGLVTNPRAEPDEVTGKYLCSRCSRVIPAVRAGEIDPSDKAISRAWPPGYNALVSLYLRYGGNPPANDASVGTRRTVVRRTKPGPKPKPGATIKLYELEIDR